MRVTDGAPLTTQFTVSNNTYYRRRTGIKNTLNFGGTAYCYNSSHTGTGCTGTRWQELSGAASSFFDSDGTYTNSATPLVGYHEDTNASNALSPNTDAVFLRLNSWDINRAHVAAWDWDGDSSVTLNPAGFLSNGDIYEVIYAGNPLGDPVIPATRYTGGNITISTVVRELAPFVGGVERVADSLPGFGAFILYKR